MFSAGHGQAAERGDSYAPALDPELVAQVMNLLDQIEQMLGEPLQSGKRARLFVELYNRKRSGEPIRLTELGDLLKAAK